MEAWGEREVLGSGLGGPSAKRPNKAGCARPPAASGQGGNGGGDRVLFTGAQILNGAIKRKARDLRNHLNAANGGDREDM